MLNWAARYFPILRKLKSRLSDGDTLLEIGSGPVGIGKFYHREFVGCDVSFPEKPRPPMLPVVATATALPFGECSFDVVIVSDVLEHIPPEQRMAVVREALRVMRKVAIFGFPSGEQAFGYDKKLVERYHTKRLKVPPWLEEHMLHPFPTETLFADLSRDWKIESFGNENLDFHYWVMCREMSPLWNRSMLIILAVLPQVMRGILRRLDRKPFYRQVFVIERHPGRV
jgi:hypothetical protein